MFLLPKNVQYYLINNPITRTALLAGSIYFAFQIIRELWTEYKAECERVQIKNGRGKEANTINVHFHSNNNVAMNDREPEKKFNEKLKEKGVDCEELAFLLNKLLEDGIDDEDKKLLATILSNIEDDEAKPAEVRVKPAEVREKPSEVRARAKPAEVRARAKPRNVRFEDDICEFSTEPVVSKDASSKKSFETVATPPIKQTKLWYDESEIDNMTAEEIHNRIYPRQKEQQTEECKKSQNVRDVHKKNQDVREGGRNAHKKQNGGKSNTFKNNSKDDTHNKL
jgi:hypothetical protein